MHEAVTAAADLCAEQTGKPPTAATLRELRADADAQAAMIAEQHAAELLFAVRSQVLRDLDGGLTAETIVRNVTQAATAQATQNLASSLQSAVASVIDRLPELLS